MCRDRSPNRHPSENPSTRPVTIYPEPRAPLNHPITSKHLHLCYSNPPVLRPYMIVQVPVFSPNMSTNPPASLVLPAPSFPRRSTMRTPALSGSMWAERLYLFRGGM